MVRTYPQVSPPFPFPREQSQGPPDVRPRPFSLRRPPGVESVAGPKVRPSPRRGGRNVGVLGLDPNLIFLNPSPERSSGGGTCEPRSGPLPPKPLARGKSGRLGVNGEPPPSAPRVAHRGWGTRGRERRAARKREASAAPTSRATRTLRRARSHRVPQGPPL